MLDKETDFFEKQLPELSKTNIGKYVLIKGEEIIGIFIAVQDALMIGYQQFKKEPFLVKQIVRFEEPLNFTNHSLII